MFSFMISGHPPPFGYLLRRSSSVLTSYVSDERLGFLSLFNVQLSNVATYRVVVTNAANPSPGLTLDPVTLTVVADGDADGLPDSWESQYGGNPSADPDLDQQSNLQEYIAGTDPTDPNSYLKVQAITSSGGALLQFVMRSNHTYTIQTRNSWDLAPWQKVSDFPALPTNRLVTITNTVEGVESRYYRLVTPRIP